MTARAVDPRDPAAQALIAFEQAERRMLQAMETLLQSCRERGASGADLLAWREALCQIGQQNHR